MLEITEAATPDNPKHHKVSTEVLHQYQEQVRLYEFFLGFRELQGDWKVCFFFTKVDLLA